MKRILLIMLCAVVACSAAFAQETKKKEKKEKKEKVTFFVEGMDCNNCVKKIEKNISFEKGVTDLKCDLSTRTAEVTYRTDKTTTDKLASAFKKIGMDATPVKDGETPQPAKKNDHGHDH